MKTPPELDRIELEAGRARLHADAWDDDRGEAGGLDPAGHVWTQAEREEYNAMLDQEDAEYWARQCPKHGELLGETGLCALCEQELAEERRQDR